jgi:hypothetical protein
MCCITVVQSFSRTFTTTCLECSPAGSTQSSLPFCFRSWKKFVRLYYVDEIVCNDSALTITITMTVDRDLRLQFSDRGQ